MKLITNILLFSLLISLHISFNGMFVLSQALFYFAAIGVICISVFFSKKNNYTSNGSCAIVCLVLYLLISYATKGNIYGTYLVYTILICWILFFAFKNLFAQDKRFLRYLFWLIVVGVYIEIGLGFGQLFGFIGNDNRLFVIGGSLGNPGAYSSYLSVIAPLLLSMAIVYKKNRKAENLYYTLLTCLGFMFFFIITLRSRGAWLACLAGCLFVLNYHYSLLKKTLIFLSTPARKISAILSLIVLLSGGFFTLYQFKADSAFGRLFVWKVTILTPHENILTGDGIGSFEANYGKWQMDYFANQKGTDAERHVADYVTCAYNEFLNTYTEQGVVGLIMLLIVLFFAFNRKNANRSMLVSGAKASLVAIIVLACVSYPFKSTLIYLHFIISLAIIFYHPQKTDYKIQKRFVLLKFVYPALGLLIIIIGFRNLYGYHLLHKGQKAVFTNQIYDALTEYKNAYPILYNNGIYLFYYGSALALNEQYEESIDMLEKSTQKSSNPNSFILLGNNYKKNANFDGAKKAYLDAIYSIPSKLYPKYLLVQLLMETSHKAEAYVWANEILSTKEKVPTTAAKEIKDEMNHLINNELSNFKNDLPMEK